MDSNAIQICVRVRPWDQEKELPYVVQPAHQTFFLGDGNFASSPRKPLSGGSLREVVEVMDKRQLDFDKPEPGAEAKRGQPGAKRYKNRRYIFDQVFSMATTQETVFEGTAKPLLSGVLDGFNATVFAYGATGCGKTHTISGTAEDPGVTVRIMRELFEMIEATKDDFDTYIELSMVEIYNELIRDLLNDDFPACPTGGLKLLENEKERVTIDRVTLRRPKTVEEVMELVLLGNQRRSTSFTASNSVSSRSHAVLQINVGRNNRGHEVDFDQALVRQCVSSATLSIIDLAGSERAAATRNMGERMKEGANINKSLLALSSCISALCQRPLRGMKPHVPYRNSKLTRMLKFSLGGNCRTVMIVCVSPSSINIEDTHNTLVWADKAKNVSTKISRNTAGVHVSVQQYLTTIAQQETRIKYLESKLEGGPQAPTGWAIKKLQSARSDAKTALDTIRGELEAGLSSILGGATNRALWDTAEMRIASFKQRIEEVEANTTLSSEAVHKEKAFLESLISQQNNAYRDNREVQAAVQKESTKTSALQTLFRSTEDRTFGDAFEAHELEGFRRGVTLQRDQLAQHISTAREKGYREASQQQAEAFGKMASMVIRMAMTLQRESDTLTELAQSSNNAAELMNIVDKLKEVETTADTALTTIFGAALLPSTAALPPLPKTASPPVIQPAVMPARRTTLGQPRRLSIQPSIATGSASFGTPVKRRPLPFADKAARLASPAKKNLRPHRVGQLRGKTPKKTTRWRDEAGQGEVDDRLTAPEAPVFSSSEESPAQAVADSASASDEWDDEEDSVEIKVDKPAIVPPPRMSLMSLPIPEWKKNRMLLGKTPVLTTLGEETESSPSPESKPSSRLGLGLMGPPTRPVPRSVLSERHAVQSTNSPPSSSFGSSLLRPTIASSSRISELKSAGSPTRRSSSIGRAHAPSGSSKMQRRVSNVGPYNKASAERKRSRGSLLPGANVSTDASLSLGGAGLPLPGTSANAAFASISGLPRRNIPSPTTSSPKDGSLGRGSSLMPPPSGIMKPPGSGFGGPRASLSIPSLPRGPPSLTSRPSMSRLSQFGMPNSSVSGLPASGSDTSIRAAWR